MRDEDAICREIIEALLGSAPPVPVEREPCRFGRRAEIVISERFPFDELAAYTPDGGSCVIDETKIARLGGLIGVDPGLIKYIVQLHNRCHGVVHAKLGSRYMLIEPRLIEHFVHHLLFCLLFDSRCLEGYFPPKFNGLIRSLSTTAHLRTFLEIHEVQPEDCKVRRNDFARFPPSWIVGSIRMLERGITQYGEWYRRVFQGS